MATPVNIWVIEAIRKAAGPPVRSVRRNHSFDAAILYSWFEVSQVALAMAYPGAPTGLSGARNIMPNNSLSIVSRLEQALLLDMAIGYVHCRRHLDCYANQRQP
jgi:hypothetical protein